ncbi:MAG TPA: M23 family metallopeptidase, partial [Microlunatus sp.]|nr:M23 family metallopeptidase [Microlunatus sp.]
PTAGVVTHAGSGGDAAGWAGNYVVIRHADGTQTLYAHMSSISVQSGTKVTGGTRLGQVGQTGRAFGPHLHFEVYPAGAEPGDVYSAVNPQPWLNKLGLKP